MSNRPLQIIILAAGKGTRMKSALPKVLHPIAGRSMLGHVIALAETARADSVVAVIGPDQKLVETEVKALAPSAKVFVQSEPLGTADAVRAARPAYEAFAGDVVVLFADTPLFKPQTLSQVRSELAAGAKVAVVGFQASDPTGYGRVLQDGEGRPVSVREHSDASPSERATRLCNAGMMGFAAEHLGPLLDAIGNGNAKKEFYLTDVVEIAHGCGLRTTVTVCPEDEVLGINSRDQLAAAEAIWQRRARQQAMLSGVTMIAPETVWLSFDTVLGEDVTIEPNVFFGPGVTVEAGAEIKANCHIERSRIGAKARVGPFARLRPGADLGPDVHIGNFVELKNTVVEAGAKANHLAYLGDSRIGERANIGAGTIFCNYDGYFKHHTDIGKDAFVGSNSSLVAPVRIGDGAFIGSGSVITSDVPADALALERSEQSVRPGWAAKFRQLMMRRKNDRRSG